MKKEYTIKELQMIFGCSRTAIVKKIKEDSKNTGVKRYKDRYEVTNKDGQIAIIFDDAELEEEKRLSKGFNTVINNGYNTVQNDGIIEIEPEFRETKEDKIINFTERYIERFATLQETMYNELRERDKQINLLTTSENTKENAYLQSMAEIKTLKKRNTVLSVILGVIITVLICVSTVLITVITVSYNDAQPEEAEVIIEQPQVQPAPEPVKPPVKSVKKK